jgi:hypothetical protein
VRQSQRYLRMLRTVCLPVVLVAFCLAPGAVGAEGEEAILTNRLLTAGIDVSSVMTSAGEVTVEYSQPVAELNSVFDCCSRWARFLRRSLRRCPLRRPASYVHTSMTSDNAGHRHALEWRCFTGQRLSPEEFMATLSFVHSRPAARCLFFRDNANRAVVRTAPTVPNAPAILKRRVTRVTLEQTSVAVSWGHRQPTRIWLARSTSVMMGTNGTKVFPPACR